MFYNHHDHRNNELSVNLRWYECREGFFFFFLRPHHHNKLCLREPLAPEHNMSARGGRMHAQKP